MKLFDILLGRKSSRQSDGAATICLKPSLKFEPGASYFGDRETTERTTALKMRVGDTFSYSALEHGSVGTWWEAEYDDTAFSMNRTRRYNHPESIERGECGGDDAVVTASFTALRSGKFKIVIRHEFRGQLEHTEIVKLTVR